MKNKMKNELNWGIFTLFLFAVVFGCTNNQGTEPMAAVSSQSDQNIIGGESVKLDTWLSNTAVFMLMENENKGHSSCTAFLVDEDVVLTAAHCVHGATYNTVVIFSPDPFANPESLSAAGKAIRIEKIRIHPKYIAEETDLFEQILSTFSPQFRHGDLALVKLERKAPADWNIVNLSGTFIDADHTDIVAAGFGRISDTTEQRADTVLRTVTLRGLLPETKNKSNEKIREILAELLKEMNSLGEKNPLSKEQKKQIDDLSNLENYFPSEIESDFLYVDQSAGKGVCSGDSGGAAFAQVKGQDVVVGIASRVGNLADSKHYCSSFGSYTNPIVYRNWLDKTFNEMKSKTSLKKTIFQ